MGNLLLNLCIAVVHESVSLVVSRQLLTELCNHIPNMESSIAKEISHFILDKLQPRAISFEEQVRLYSVYHVTVVLKCSNPICVTSTACCIRFRCSYIIIV